MKNTAKSSKLSISLRLWVEIKNKELGYSEDLRKNETIEQADMMIEKIKGMMA